MIDIENIKSDIVQRLKPLDLDKIVLFGSYAYGTPNEKGVSRHQNGKAKGLYFV